MRDLISTNVRDTMNKFRHALGGAILPNGARIARGGVDIFETPTEDIIEQLTNGRGAATVRGMAKKVKVVRREENYLFSTRRFPANSTNDTIGSGAIVAGDYDFFGNGIGDGASAMGYGPSLPTLTRAQTNMDKGGKIPTGKGFALYELAVSLSANAKSADVGQLLDTMYLGYEKQGGQLVINHGPIRFWPGGTGISGLAAGGTVASAAALDVASNGVTNLAAVRRFRNARMLNANDTFKYFVHANDKQFKNGTAIALTDFVEVCVWMFGFHYDRIPG